MLWCACYPPTGEFIGGADIVEQLHTSGELKELISSAGAVTRKA